MNARGFTLVETLVVLAIVGVAASLAVPALRPPAPTVASVAAAIAEAHAVARQAAVSEGRVTTADLDVAAARIVVRTAAGDTLRDRTLRAPAGLTIGSAAGSRWARTRWDPSGRARGDVITLRVGDDSATLSTEVWTGVTATRSR